MLLTDLFLYFQAILLFTVNIRLSDSLHFHVLVYSFLLHFKRACHWLFHLLKIFLFHLIKHKLSFSPSNLRLICSIHILNVRFEALLHWTINIVIYLRINFIKWTMTHSLTNFLTLPFLNSCIYFRFLLMHWGALLCFES